MNFTDQHAHDLRRLESQDAINRRDRGLGPMVYGSGN